MPSFLQLSIGMFGVGLAGLHCSLGVWDKVSNAGLFQILLHICECFASLSSKRIYSVDYHPACFLSTRLLPTMFHFT